MSAREQLSAEHIAWLRAALDRLPHDESVCFERLLAEHAEARAEVERTKRDAAQYRSALDHLSGCTQEPAMAEYAAGVLKAVASRAANPAPAPSDAERELLCGCGDVFGYALGEQLQCATCRWYSGKRLEPAAPPAVSAPLAMTDPAIVRSYGVEPPSAVGASDHAYVAPGRVASDCEPRDACVQCGRARAEHPAAMGNAYCDHECPGYNDPPRSGHLWWSEWRDHVAALKAAGKERG